MRAVFVHPAPASGQWVAAQGDAAIGEQRGFVLSMEEGRQLGAVPAALGSPLCAHRSLGQQLPPGTNPKRTGRGARRAQPARVAACRAVLGAAGTGDGLHSCRRELKARDGSYLR